MAIQDKTLAGAEHDWYATRSGLSNSATLTEHKVKYFSDKGFGGANKPVSQMEREWLQNIGGSSANNEGDLWSEVLSNLGLTPTGSVSQNKFLFFTSVADSPPA